jgi:hypothetical protein
MGFLACAASLAAPGLASAATAADQLYERTLMTAADGRCRLFAPAIGSALDAARAQARGATLRSGVSQAQVEGVEQRARAKAAGAACNSKDLTTAADRVRTAFDAYKTMQRITYPGDVSSWQAERTSSATIPIWRLSQPSSFGADRLIFGLAGRTSSVTAAATFSNGERPYAARIVLRDTGRTQGPYIDARGGRALSSKVSPRSASLVFNAETREESPLTLLPAGSKTGLSFRFPPGVADAISRLDPREAVTIEFSFARGGIGDADLVRKAYVEVGDFAAGRAFLR